MLLNFSIFLKCRWVNNSLHKESETEKTAYEIKHIQTINTHRWLSYLSN